MSGDKRLEELRVDFHARRRSVEGRRAHVAEARRQGADENDPAVDLASIDPACNSVAAGITLAAFECV